MGPLIPISSDSYASTKVSTKHLKDGLIGTNVDEHNGWLSGLENCPPRQIRRNLIGNGLATSPNILSENIGSRYSIQESGIVETSIASLNGRYFVYNTAIGGDFDFIITMETERER